MAHVRLGSVEIVGRDVEAGQVAWFLDSGTGELVLEGEAGIGKTSVWLAGLALAGERGLRALVARPSEVETRLPYATLSDLLEPVADDALRSMPPPQARALEIALLRREPQQAWDSRAVSAATLTALRVLSAETPTLLAVDDTQWVDPASADALGFAVRRLRGGPFCVLATERVGVGGGLVLPDATRVPVLPLGADALCDIVRLKLGLELRRPAVLRLATCSGGNPFFALELARDGRLLASDDAPLPPSLDDVLRVRLARAPRDVRDALLVAAAHRAPTAKLLEAAGVTGDSMQRGVDLDLLVPINDGFRLAHPLIGSSVYSRTTPVRRRDVHGRLAAALDNPDERAPHLALATIAPNETVAKQLELASDRAARRGARQAAADLAAHAVRLSSSRTPEAWRRMVVLADLVGVAGNAEEARRLFQHVIQEMPAGPDRAAALVRLAAWSWTDMDVAARSLERALAETDGAGRARALLRLSEVRHARGEIDESARLLDEAVPLAEHENDARTLELSLVRLAVLRFSRGDGVDEEGLRRAQQLHVLDKGPPSLGVHPELALAECLMLVGELDRASQIYEHYRSLATEFGDEVALAEVLAVLSNIACHAGNPESAEAFATQSVGLARQLGEPAQLGYALCFAGRVRARLGLVEQASDDAHEASAQSERAGHELFRLVAIDVLGYLALSLGVVDRAVECLERVLERMRTLPWREPAPVEAHHNLAEAYVRRGELDKAEIVLDDLEAVARPTGRVRSLAGAARVRGMIAAARGDVETAVSRFEESLAIQARLPEPHETGRTELALGSVLRRANRKRAARAVLDEAVRTLDACGARLWANQARGELARISGRPIRAGALTPTEEQIADLVAAGRSNDEVARSVSLSPKTVEWNLSKIYRKLDVRSRGELAAKLGRRRASAR